MITPDEFREHGWNKVDERMFTKILADEPVPVRIRVIMVDGRAVLSYDYILPENITIEQVEDLFTSSRQVIEGRKEQDEPEAV